MIMSFIIVFEVSHINVHNYIYTMYITQKRTMRVSGARGICNLINVLAHLTVKGWNFVIQVVYNRVVLFIIIHCRLR